MVKNKGEWSPFSFMNSHQGSFGAQIGGKSTFCVILLMNETSGALEKQVALSIAITAVLALCLLFLIGARQVMHALGHSGNQVLMRLMGLIVMAIAVEFFFSGLRPIVQSMLR